MFFEEKFYLLPDRQIAEFATGGFSKKTLVCVLHEPEFPQNTDFLKKVLLAAGLDLEKDTLYAEIPATEPLSLAQFLNEKAAENVLVFGISPTQLGLKIEAKPYQPTHFLKSNFLFADKLSLLEPDRDRKSKLWTALKTMFLK